MLQSGKLSYEEIAEIAELFIDEVKALDKKVLAGKNERKKRVYIRSKKH